MARERLLGREKDKRKKRKIRPFGYPRQMETPPVEIPDVLELGRPYNVVEVLQNVKPEPTPGHPYWVEKDIPADFAATLPREELAALEQKKPYFIVNADTKVLDVNPEAFDPTYTLEKDERRLATGHDTQYISQLLAMSAASAPTPEKQTALFKAFGETVLRVHTADPELLQHFLLAQTPESREQFADVDFNAAMSHIDENYQQLEMNADRDYQEKFGKPHTLTTTPTAEEQEFVDVRSEEILARQQEYEATLLRNFAQYPERQLAMEVVPTQEENLLQQFILHIHIPETAEAWRPRVVALQEALHQEPLTLTLEQMGQIDFLSHSVDIKRLVALAQGNSAPESQQAPALQEEADIPSESLETVFANLAVAKESLPEKTEERRDEL